MQYNTQALRHATARLVTAAAVMAAAAGVAQSKTTAIVGGTIYPVSGPPIEEGVLLIEDGKIAAVGTDIEIPEDAERIDAAGQRIYPSMISAHTQLGLVEINAVEMTLDSSETGAYNPNAMAHKAFNPDSELIDVTRSNGVLLAVTAPSGGRIAGQASLMQLEGWTWEKMLVEPGVAMIMRWPSVGRPRGRGRGGEEQSGDRQDPIDELSEYLTDARAYEEARRHGDQPRDLRWEAMLPVIHGEQPVWVQADAEREIQAAVAFAEREGLRIVILGGYDAPHCAELLKSRDVPVIIDGVYRVPQRRHDSYDTAYRLPAALHDAGVKFCIAGTDREAASTAKNLPYHAGAAVAFGLPEDEALKSITLYAAQILGVDDRFGSLEPGKEATLFITDGDPLETTSNVIACMVAGEPIDMANRHTRLYEKFRQRLESPGEGVAQ